MADITTIFFDMGSVLLNVDEKGALARMGKRISRSPDDILAALDEAGLLDKLGRGEITPDEFFAKAAALLGVSTAVTPGEMKDIWRSMLTPKPEIVKLASSLKGKYRLFLLSNTDSVHHAHAATIIPLDKIFEGQVVSYLVGAEKPSERIYHIALDMAREKAEKCVFIDDLPKNVEAARAVGIHGIVFKDSEQLRRDLAKLGVKA